MMEIVTSIVLLVLGIALLVTIHICIVGRAFLRGSDHGNNNNNGGSTGNQRGINTRSQSMSQDDIKKLPCFDYKGVEEAEEEMIGVMNGGGGGCECSSSRMDDCAVCLENFKVGDKCRLLPNCRHSFHAQCIDSWLVKNGACPICRTGADEYDDGIELKRISGESSRNSLEVRGVSIEMV